MTGRADLVGVCRYNVLGRGLGCECEKGKGWRELGRDKKQVMHTRSDQSSQVTQESGKPGGRISTDGSYIDSGSLGLGEQPGGVLEGVSDWALALRVAWSHWSQRLI